MNKQNRIECPNCHYKTGMFCAICDGRGYTEVHVGVDMAKGYDSGIPQFQPQTVSCREGAWDRIREELINEVRVPSNLPPESRKLAYQSPDPEAEKRRLACLNLAMNAYQFANCPGMFGSPANNAMSWEDITSLAARMEKFIKNEGYSPHEE